MEFIKKLSVGFAALQVIEDRLMPRLARSPVVGVGTSELRPAAKSHAPCRMPRPSFLCSFRFPFFAVSLLVLSPMTLLLTDTSLRWVHLGPVRPFELDRSEYHLCTKSKSIPLKKKGKALGKDKEKGLHSDAILLVKELSLLKN